MQEHQREESTDLGIIGEAGVHEPREPDRLGAQIVAREVVTRRRGVALVEDQVEAREHSGEPFLEQPRGWDAERNTCFEDLALGAHDALRQCRLAHHERPGQLGRAESGDGLQRERDPRFDRERGVTAREQETQSVVFDRRGGDIGGGVGVVVFATQPRDLAGEVGVAAQPVEGLAARGGGDPRPGLGRNALLRPHLERDRERILRGVFGQRQIAEPPGETGDHASPFDAHRALDRREHVGSDRARCRRGGDRFAHRTILLARRSCLVPRVTSQRCP